MAGATWVAVVSLAVGGCGSAEAERASVQGTVKVAGKPVEDGSIMFCPTGTADGKAKGKPVGVAIVNGSYQMDVSEGPVVGTARIEIQSFRKTGRKVPDLQGDVSKPDRPLIDEKINTLPPKYNIETTLVKEVTPGSNTFDFDLR